MSSKSPSFQGAIIQARNISRVVDGPEGHISILDGIDLDVEKGSSLAVVGSSGSGKSTLLGLLAGLDLPDSGQISIDGHDITAMNEDQRSQWRAGRIGFVFQSFHLMTSLNALENVMLPLELSGFGQPRQQATELLAAVGLSHRLGHYPKQLSGGEQQRVALARAFAARPSILFADEPTGNLDNATGEKVEQLLFDLQSEQGTTLVLVTHDTTLAERCQQRMRLDGGQRVAP